MSDHRPRAFVSAVASTLSFSTFVLVFNNQHFSATQSVFVATIQKISQFFCTQFESISLFSARCSNSASIAARTTVSCSKSAHARLLLQGPPDLGIAPHLGLGVTLF